MNDAGLLAGRAGGQPHTHGHRAGRAGGLPGWLALGPPTSLLTINSYIFLYIRENMKGQNTRVDSNEMAEVVATEDLSPPTLSSLLATDGIAQYFSTCVDASTTAMLASCSTSTAAVLGDAHIWANLLAKQFGIDSAEAHRLPQPKRAYAQRIICERWGLVLPHTRSERRAPALAAGLQTPKPRAFMAKASPKTQVAKENVPPREPLGRLSQDHTRSSTPASSADADSPVRLNKCTISRLRHGLHEIMMRGPAGIRACPEQPDDWAVWTAKVICSDDDGSIVAGTEFSARLRFPPDADAENETDGLPEVEITRPVCFHPNIDERSGRVCPAALRRRILPTQLIGDQLTALADLLRRPVFDTKPANETAAAMWYGDRNELAAQMKLTSAPPLKPSPDLCRVLSL